MLHRLKLPRQRTLRGCDLGVHVQVIIYCPAMRDLADGFYRKGNLRPNSDSASLEKGEYVQNGKNHKGLKGDQKGKKEKAWQPLCGSCRHEDDDQQLADKKRRLIDFPASPAVTS